MKIIRWSAVALVLFIGLSLAGAILVPGWRVQAAPEDSVVGAGTPASCTEAAFNAALNSGGEVTFNCGPNPVIINLTNLKTISAMEVSIDGGNKITLSRGLDGGIFLVEASGRLTLKNITMRGGSLQGHGSIENKGIFTATNVIITHANVDPAAMSNLAYRGAISHSPALINSGQVHFINSVLQFSRSHDDAGGPAMVVSNTEGARMEIRGSQFLSNTTGVINARGSLTIDGSLFRGNRGNVTGILFSAPNDNPPLLSISNSIFQDNHGDFMGHNPSQPSPSGGPVILLSRDVSPYTQMVMTNTIFISNTNNTRGGAIFAGFRSNAVIHNSEFRGNKSGSDGGAIFIDSSIDIVNSVFTDNVAQNVGKGGAIHIGGLAGLGSINNTFTSNSADSGGAVYNTNYFYGAENTFTGNQARRQGGALVGSGGTSYLYNSNLSQNSAVDGGAIALVNSFSGIPPTFTGAGLTIQNNSAANNFITQGGGIFALSGSINLSRSAIVNNQALGTGGRGGGLYSEASTTLTNVTLSGNRAGETGGNLRLGGSGVFTNITVVNGQAETSHGGNVVNFGSYILRNSVIASGSGPDSFTDNCFFANFTSGGHNLLYDPVGAFNNCGLTDPTDLTQLDPLLGELADNGGNTLSRLPALNSPLRNAADNAFCPAEDQRGYLRSRSAADACDIGAVESSGHPTFILENASAPESQVMLLNFRLRDNHPQPADISIHFVYSDGVALSGLDYSGKSGSILLPAGQTSGVIPVILIDDNLYEGVPETMTVSILDLSGSLLLGGPAIGTILDNETFPSLWLGDANVLETNFLTLTGPLNANFPITLSSASAFTISVHVEITASGTSSGGASLTPEQATPGVDFMPLNFDLIIPPGNHAANIAVPIFPDLDFEFGEPFTATLSNPTGATIGQAVGIGVIVNDDPLPTASLGGFVFNDLDADRRRASDELTGIPSSVRIEGITLLGDPINIVVNTDPSGAWLANGLGLGHYRVQPFGFNTSRFVSLASLPASLLLPPQGVNNLNFPMFDRSTLSASGGVLGRVFIDDNRNGFFDPGEQPVSGASLVLAGFSGNSRVASRANGLFAIPFAGSPVDRNFGVSVHPPVNSDLLPIPFFIITKNIAPGFWDVRRVGLVRRGSLSGVVNALGKDPLFDFQIEAGLTIELLQNGVVISQTTSLSNGFYTFGALADGDYELKITPPSGWTPQRGLRPQPIHVSVLPFSVSQLLSGSPRTTVENINLLRSGELIVDVEQAGAGPLRGVDVIVRGEGFEQRSRTDSFGRARLNNMPVGLFEVSLDPATLPAGSIVNGSSPRLVNFTQPQGRLRIQGSNVAFKVDIGATLRPSCTQPLGSEAFPCLVEVRVVTNTFDAPPGTLIANASLGEFNPGLNVSDLPSGIYTVRMQPDPNRMDTHGYPFTHTVALNPAVNIALAYPFTPDRSFTRYIGQVRFDPGFGAFQTNNPKTNGIPVQVFLNDALQYITYTHQVDSANAGVFALDFAQPGTYRVDIDYPIHLVPRYGGSFLLFVDFKHNPTNGASFVVSEPLLSPSGYIFIDRDNDGIFDAQFDAPLQGITVTLETPAGVIVDRAASFSDGWFSLNRQIFGYYVLRAQGVPGLFIGKSVTVLNLPSEPGRPFTPRNALAMQQDDRLPRVVVFLDRDLDGKLDPSEPRLGGVGVRFHNGFCNSTGATSNAVTDNSGVAVGASAFTRTGCVEITSGLPAGAQAAPPGSIFITAGNNQARPLPVRSGGTLTVHPYWDRDGDQIMDEDEPVLSEVNVRLTRGSFHSSALSSEDGVTFANIIAGSYEIDVDTPTGMQFTGPRPARLSLVSGSASSVAIPLVYTGAIQGRLTLPGGRDGACCNILLKLRGRNTGVFLRTSTDSGGYFQFPSLPDDLYTLTLADTLPNGMTMYSITAPHQAGKTSIWNRSLFLGQTIQGMVGWDANLDGSLNFLEEPGAHTYPGGTPITITLRSYDNPDIPFRSIRPGSDGRFTITGLDANTRYFVRLNLPRGVSMTDGAEEFRSGEYQARMLGIGLAESSDLTAPGTVSGAFYLYDPSRACQLNNCPPVSNHGAIIGGIVELYRCNAPGVVVASARSQAPDGSFSFTPPDFSRYCVRGNPLSSGLTSPDNSRGRENFITVIESGGRRVVGRNITLDLITRPVLPLGPQAGTAVFFSAFADDNLNGARDSYEAALPGVSITLDSGLQLTNNEGLAMFANITNGQCAITVTVPAGYQPGGLGSHFDIFPSSQDSIVSLPIVLADALQGAAFVDLDGDGQQGAEEPGLAGVNIAISGAVIANTVTDENGVYRVIGLPQGAYSVAAAPPSGYNPLPSRSQQFGDGGQTWAFTLSQAFSGLLYQDWDGDGLRNHDEEILRALVTVTLNSTSQPTFGPFIFDNPAPGSYTLSSSWAGASPNTFTGAAGRLGGVEAGVLRGVAWFDSNADDKRQSWEIPASGLSISVTTSAGTRSATTDANGQYEFTNLPTGNFTLAITPPDGFTTHVALNGSLSTDHGAAVGIPLSIAQPNQQQIIYLPMLRR